MSPPSSALGAHAVSLPPRRRSSAAGLARRCLLGCLVWLFAPLAAAAPEQAASPRWAPWSQVLFQRISTGNLAADAMGATALAQDHDGFIWVGTQNGLARWDGYRFRVYRAKPELATGLPDAYLQALHVDPHGQLWLGSSSRGLVRYRADSDDFETLGAGPQGLRHVSVKALADAADGGLWVGTEAGLDHLDPRSGRVRHVELVAETGQGQPMAINQILSARDGTLWLATSRGLWRGDARGEHFSEQAVDAKDRGGSKVSALLQDKQGRLWVGLTRDGVRLLKPAPSGSLAPATFLTLPEPLGRVHTRAMVETQGGEVWLTSYGQGIVAVNLGTLQSRHFQREQDVPYALNNNDVWAMLSDRSGRVWVGTIDSLLHVEPQAPGIHTLMGGGAAKALLSTAEVNFVQPMPDGRIWVGSGNNGIDVLDPASGRVDAWRPDPRHPQQSLPREPLMSSVVMPDGEVYVGSLQGMYQVKPATRQVRRVTLPGRSPSEGVMCLYQDAQGVWMGGESDGLWLLREDGRGQWHVLHHSDQVLSDQRVETIRAAGPGRLWVGTRNGLNLYDELSHRVLSVLLKGALVGVLATDNRSRLWVGTAGSGLYVIDQPQSAQPRIRHLDTRQGLPNDAVDQILFDDDGRAWLSTDQGLAVVDPETLRVRALGPSEGVGITQYWLGQGSRIADGELMFGGLGGATVVNPRLVQAPVNAMSVVLTDLRVGDATLATGAFHRPGAASVLTLPPQARGFSVEFSALDFGTPQDTRYAYRLLGFDSDWVETDASRRSATYTNLPPGQYTLEIRAADAESDWAARALRVAVKVEPAWYQQLWLRVLAVALAVLAVVAVERARTLLLVRRQRELQQLVDERTAALRQSEARLEQLAYFDPLTGLPNRRMLMERFEQARAQARREHGTFALLLIDLDRFKQVNDSLGHAAGDALLMATAERLQAVVREVDTVARIGGDEFAILLLRPQGEQPVEVVCERILQAYQAPVMFGASPMLSSPSIGAAIYPRHGQTLDQLSSSADRALYAAKDAGRNTWRLAESQTGQTERA